MNKILKIIFEELPLIIFLLISFRIMYHIGFKHGFYEAISQIEKDNSKQEEDKEDEI